MSGFKTYFKYLIIVLCLFGIFACSTFKIQEDDLSGKTYTITFDSVNGSSVDSQSVGEGLKVNKPADPTRAGYDFLIWTNSAGDEYDFANTPVTNDLTLYAQWIVLYTVTFDSVNGSSVIEPQDVREGSNAVRPPDIGKIIVGYSFLTWTNSAGGEYDFANTPVTNDLTLYAQWIPLYTVTFDSVNGSSVDSQIIREGSNAVRPVADPTRVGYDFLTWTNSAGGEYDFANTPVTGDLTLYAQWIRLYAITFDSRGGSSVTPQLVREGSNAVKPNDPIKANYDLDVWYTNIYKGSAYDFVNTPVTGDLTLYASWTGVPNVIVYNIVLDFNDGVTPDRTVEVIEGEALSDQNLPTPQHPDSAYSFYGWYTTVLAEEGDEYDTNQAIMSDVTVYAKWLTDDLEKVAYLKIVPNDLSGYDQLTREVLSLYKVGAQVVTRYVNAQPEGTGFANNWANASDNLKQVVDNITDASEDKVYLVLVTGEVYTPDTITMKNYVAIIGGYHPDGSWKRPSGERTVLDGEYARRLFNNDGTVTAIGNTALLYEITIYRGDTGSDANTSIGEGMLNINASPTLWKVVFKDNNTQINANGGGMYNINSSSILRDVEFSGNRAWNGAGMFGRDSSLVLSNVIFSNNHSIGANNNWGGSGAAIYFDCRTVSVDCSLSLNRVSFLENKSLGNGGALKVKRIKAVSSSLVPVYLKDVVFQDNNSQGDGGAVDIFDINVLFENVTFENNKATGYGGAVNYDSSSSVFVNTTFYRNEAKKGSVILIGNSRDDNGSAPHLKFINVTALDNNTTEIDGGDLHVASTAHHIPSNDGGSTQLINSIFWDKNITDNGKLVYINNDSSTTRMEDHEFALVYSAIGGTATDLNGTGSEVVTSEATTDLVAYTPLNIIVNNITFGPFQNNGGVVKTVRADGTGVQDSGIYVKWNYTSWIEDAIFYYSENDSDWFGDLGLTDPKVLPMDARELNDLDARSFNRVGRPDMGSYEIQ